MIKDQLYNEDYLKILKELPDNSIDLVLTDPPYGTTTIEWDKVLDFKVMWVELKRIMKPKSNALFFGSQPFSSFVVSSLRASGLRIALIMEAVRNWLNPAMVALTMANWLLEPRDLDNIFLMPAAYSTARTPPPAITPVP